ncbi:MAG: inositol monophosphatase family protein [Candidatus Eisenbacteria bacterium]
MRDEEIIRKVIPAIMSAGEIARQGFRRSKVVSNTPRCEVTTDIDLKVDEAIVSFLSEEFPDHGVISEESGEKKPDADCVWIVDPIDGTRHFARGIPLYGISVALRTGGALAIGVVYFPENDELFTAVKGHGAHLNGEQISCSRETDLEKALICLEIPSRHDTEEVLDRALTRMRKLILNCLRVRIVGIASLGLCHCASGAYDGYVNLGAPPKVWDVAAGEIIVTEAGGRIAYADGAGVAGHPFLYDRITEVLKTG